MKSTKQVAGAGYGVILLGGIFWMASPDISATIEALGCSMVAFLTPLVFLLEGMVENRRHQ